jgi:hypothetical protein
MRDRTRVPAHAPAQLGALVAFGPDLDPTSPDRALTARSPKAAAITATTAEAVTR